VAFNVAGIYKTPSGQNPCDQVIRHKKTLSKML